jgi:hypothetical protein
LVLLGKKRVGVKHPIKLDVVLKVAEIWPEEAVIHVL